MKGEANRKLPYQFKRATITLAKDAKNILLRYMNLRINGCCLHKAKQFIFINSQKEEVLQLTRCSKTFHI